MKLMLCVKIYLIFLQSTINCLIIKRPCGQSASSNTCEMTKFFSMICNFYHMSFKNIKKRLTYQMLLILSRCTYYSLYDSRFTRNSAHRKILSIYTKRRIA